MTNSLKPLPEPWPQTIAEILAGYPSIDGYILTLFRTFANSERFLKKAVPNLLDRGSPLPLRIREIVILRVTANLRCEYEWGVHVTGFAKAAKLGDAQIAAILDSRIDPALWAPEEFRLIEAIDALCARGTMDEPTRESFQSDWTAEQQLEILALCGTYHTVSYVANVARLPNEAFGAAFP